MMDAEQLPLSVYYLRITLKDSKPLIWRDILVPSNLNLENLHYVIQAAMGWDGSHLHQFIADKVLYTDAIENNNGDQYGLDNNGDADEYDRNEKKYTVSQLLPQEHSSIIYEYDPCDSWTHQIELKKILPVDNDVHRPRCVKGAQACPPEDCGGIWGYTDMLEAIQNDKNAEGEDVLIKSDNDFNPDYFDIEAVNKALKHLLISNLHIPK